MEIEAYVCPSCGGQLDVDQSTTFTFCPHCGNRLHISYADEKDKESGVAKGMRQFTSSSGVPLGSAVVPETYSLSGQLNERWQSNMVPFTVVMNAVGPEGDILFTTTSRELFAEYTNPMIKKMVPTLPGQIKNSFRDCMSPEDYLYAYAQQVVNGPLELVAKTSLPSAFSKNPQTERDKVLSVINAENVGGVQMQIGSLICDPILLKYTARINGRDTLVLAGADWVYADAENTNKMLGALSGMMLGGLLGKRLGGSANTKKADMIVWGSGRRYAMAAPLQKEDEATEDFVKFVASVTPDPALAQRDMQMASQKQMQMMQNANQMQMQAQQMQMQAQQRQMDLSRQLARNNAQVSAGIMDSWEKKSAAQSRMSANYSEAVRGVNSYVTPTGQYVEASVVADHVYQNQYGDTFGVSGRALDAETANKLNWTELRRK